MADPAAPGFETHRVENQPPPLAELDLFATDRALAEGFCAARLGEERAGGCSGLLPRSLDPGPILARVRPD